MKEAVGSKGGKDTVVASITETLANNVEHLVLTGTKAISGTGNTLGNTLTGNTGKNVLKGGGGNDSLDGGSGNDTLNGDAGRDLLDGGIGTDKLNGGTDNDILVWASTDSYDGGSGVDTLKIDSGELNLTAVASSKIRNVEQIDLTAVDNNLLTLNARDVLDISSSTNTLKVLGSAGDSVDIVGSFTTGAVSGGFRTYRVGTGTLLVDTDIAVV